MIILCIKFSNALDTRSIYSMYILRYSKYTHNNNHIFQSHPQQGKRGGNHQYLYQQLRCMTFTSSSLITLQSSLPCAMVENNTVLVHNKPLHKKILHNKNSIMYKKQNHKITYKYNISVQQLQLQQQQQQQQQQQEQQVSQFWRNVSN